VVKDAGDDPDVTHRAVIRAKVRRNAGNGIILRGGPGVGTVTRPGLPVAVGLPAINPVPREQITLAVTEAMDEKEGWTLRSASTAAKNWPKKPSTRVWALSAASPSWAPGARSSPSATPPIRPPSASVWTSCRPAGCARPCLTTGGRSERFLRQARPHTQETACVQVADFFSFSMREVGRRGFDSVLWGVFFGKLVKQAQGHRYTHARSSELDLTILATWCAQCGFTPQICQEVAGANTAMQVLELLKPLPETSTLFALLTDKAAASARLFCGREVRVDYLLFDFSGQILHATTEAA
jgi:cobalt-precorrin-5B (C1)-methyltransferase